MYNLFLDDVRQPSEPGNYMSPANLRSVYQEKEWVTVRNYNEFTNHILTHGLPNIVSFDHDLADIHYDPTTCKESFEYTEETGYDCAKWLVMYCDDNGLPLPEYLCHSMNPIGKENIISYLDSYKKKV